MQSKLKVTAKTAVFKIESEADNFINDQLCENKYLTFVSSDVREINGLFKATIIFSNPYDAAKFVLEHRSLDEIKTIAKLNKVSLTGDQLVNTTLSRADIERKIESGEIKDSYIKYNLDNLFGEDSLKFRKQAFKAHGIDINTQKIKKTNLNKNRLISKLLMEASTFNYDDYSYQVAFLINK